MKTDSDLMGAGARARARAGTGFIFPQRMFVYTGHELDVKLHPMELSFDLMISVREDYLEGF